MPQHLERISKTAAALSVLLIVLVLFAFHPDLTWLLRIAIVLAMLVGWIATRADPEHLHALWLLAAPLAPAVLGRIAGFGDYSTALDLVWMAGLGAGLLGTVSWTRWALPAWWAVLLGGWALTLSLGWPVLVAREVAFDPALFRDMGAINSWALLPAPHVVAWMLHVVLSQLLGVLWLDWAVGWFAAGTHRLPVAGHALWIGATIASAVALIQGVVDLSFLNTAFWASEGRASGTMFDANGFGVCAAIAGPFGFVAVRTLRPQSALMPWAILAVNWTGMWMSGSRTALLCAVAGAAGLAIGMWRTRQLALPRKAWFAVALAGGVLVAILVAGAVGPLRRFTELSADRAGLADLWNRGGYGTIAAQMVREYPLTGVGVGSFHVLAPDYYRVQTDDQLAFDNAQNWWRHQAAELGLLGALPVTMWSLAIGWLAIAGRRQEGGPGTSASDVVEVSTLRGLLAGVGIVSLLGMPTQNPVVLLWFFLLVAWTHALISAVPTQASPHARGTRAGWIVVTALALAYSAGHLVLATGSLSVAERARRFNREYVAGAYASETLPDGRRFRWTDDESRLMLPAGSPWLVVRLWAHHPDVTEIPVGVTLSTACGVVWSGDLRTRDTVDIGVTLPDRLRVVDATVSVSRTWQPSDHGSADTRHLGVGIDTEFVDSPDDVRGRAQTVAWPDCP